ncbi:MAG: hypothetical protein M0R80_01230 [Proteobacteria bacterium]|jgi:hypothetical protein|nr:hypothetical protein [Pseudomonadota bacterium]
MLPNYVHKEDLIDRIAKEYFGDGSIPIAIKRINDRWCEFVQVFRNSNSAHAAFAGDYEGQLYKIYLPQENQLKSVNELLEEYCAENNIPFVNMVC